MTWCCPVKVVWNQEWIVLTHILVSFQLIHMHLQLLLADAVDGSVTHIALTLPKHHIVIAAPKNAGSGCRNEMILKRTHTIRIHTWITISLLGRVKVGMTDVPIRVAIRKVAQVTRQSTVDVVVSHLVSLCQQLGDDTSTS